MHGTAYANWAVSGELRKEMVNGEQHTVTVHPGADLLLAFGVRFDDRVTGKVEKFCEHDGMQCGFCTPGFVMAVRGFCNEHPKATLEDCRKGLGGNICRCGTYAGVLQAAFDTAQAAK